MQQLLNIVTMYTALNSNALLFSFQYNKSQVIFSRSTIERDWHKKSVTAFVTRYYYLLLLYDLIGYDIEYDFMLLLLLQV